ncbi:heparinase II/III family protein, partial [Staphylococcus aureus]
RAENALAHRVDLLGSGPKELGTQIEWHTDFKTGLSWPPRYFSDIDYNNLGRPSDVKVPWELSRLQWLIPVGQAFLLTRDDRYAAEVRDVL